jgi:hypothetical protein
MLRALPERREPGASRASSPPTDGHRDAVAQDGEQGWPRFSRRRVSSVANPAVRPEASARGEALVSSWWFARGLWTEAACPFTRLSTGAFARLSGDYGCASAINDRSRTLGTQSAMSSMRTL